MRRYLRLGGVVGNAIIGMQFVVPMLIAMPAQAAATAITNVQVDTTDTGVKVVLNTGRGERPQVFTVVRGNSLVADIINTRLALSSGNGFLQNNPAPGISSIAVSQLDDNSVRVIVSGEGDPPGGQAQQVDGAIVLNVQNPATAAQANSAPASTSESPEAAAPPPAPSSPPAPPAPAPSASNPSPESRSSRSSNRSGDQSPSQASNRSSQTAQQPLVPNPGVVIDGVPVPAPSNTPAAPPFVGRATPPPLGDIATASIDASPDSIDLGSNEIVPRLVLRDAPVRDVLSLLARAANLNVAYIGADATQEGQAQGQAPAQQGAAPGEATDESVRVSLDIENEPVQNVFNYVLRVANLEANLVGRTVFVGPRLPDTARNVVSRTLRLNQIRAEDAASFLTSQGAETQIPIERVDIQTVGEGAAARTIETRTPQILNLRAQRGAAPLMLTGLAVSTNSRLNMVTLVGTPRQVQIAAALLSQLDLRQRQVAVNVKVVDVNLLATEDFNTSFSFGAGDTFVSSDNGAISVNFGNVRPPGRVDVNGSRLSPPITNSPLNSIPGVDSDIEPFLDAQPDAPYGDTTGQTRPFTIEEDSPDGTTVRVPVNDPNYPNGVNPRPPFGTNDNPLQPGVTDVDTDGTITVGLPDLFQYPKRFLASLQAQVVSGNAKILTDPTLIVQEGQAAKVVLAQDVVTNVQTIQNFASGTVTQTTNIQTSPAGLTLDLSVARIDDNGFVTLQVAPLLSAPTQTYRDASGNEITLLARRELNSGLIRVRDGQALILSGIIQDSDRTTVTKVPILGDIPILGALFRSTRRQNARQEVIVVLTPRILDDSEYSTFGYRYTPGREAQEMLNRRGVNLP